jgi:SecD/SecF fusion protein
MDKHAVWKWLVLAALLAGSMSTVIPWREKVRFGLDLKGGISFVCTVDREQTERDIRAQAAGGTVDEEQIRRDIKEALRGAQERAIVVLRNRLNGLGIEEPSIVAKSDRIEIQLPGVGEEKRIQAEQSILSVGVLEFRMAHERTMELTDQLMREGKAPAGYKVVSLGGGHFYVPTADVPSEKRDDAYLKQLGRWEVPSPAYEFMLAKEEINQQTVYRPYFVRREAVLRGEHLKNATPTSDELNRPVVSLDFTAKGAKKFGHVTELYAPGGPENPDADGSRYLGIAIDNMLYSAPRINEPIYGGRAQITGSFTIVEQQRLVNVLRSGALPTRIKIEDKRYVAPSLGTDSIRSGLKSVVLGGMGVVVFMAVYYLACGLVADLALLLNLLLLPLGMVVAAGFLSLGQGFGGAAIQLPVLTLPGIAGIALTIGMAVDANVLVFERIREELRVGKKLWTAITAGYDRAFVTILDANLTTLLVGVILFVLGSGPIRGFAVTLCAGILVSMYTALTVTKLIFGLITKYTKIQTLHMFSIIRETVNVDFVGKRKLAAVISLALIVVTLGIMVGRTMREPGRVFGVDFTGGGAMTFAFTAGQQAPVEAIRDSLNAAGVLRPVIQYQREIDGGEPSTLQIKMGVEPVNGQKQSDIVREVLLKQHPAAGYRLVAEDDVGPQIGAELKRNALWAISAALLGIILYLSWRFEFGFALGAIVALVHDVFVTVGLYSLCGQQIDLPIVAALLTIVGYSVNDTIVVFDRIREDLRLDKSKSFKEICNLSINQTLSRTVLTSLTTLITIVLLLVFGGGAIFGFALALCIGVLVGTYSSIFVATPIVLLWHRDKKPEMSGAPTKIA